MLVVVVSCDILLAVVVDPKEVVDVDVIACVVVVLVVVGRVVVVVVDKAEELCGSKYSLVIFRISSIHCR
jgi:hypothetical protein